MSRRHQLQIVDNDQPQLAALAVQPPCAGAQVDGVERGRFVDIQGCLVHLAERKGQARPFIVVQASGSNTMSVQPADRRQHTHRQLGAAHFHGENSHRQTDLDGHMFADIQCERRLTHRRATGDDQQITRLQAGGASIEIVVTGRNTSNIGRVVAVV